MGCLPPPYLPVVLVKGTEREGGGIVARRHFFGHPHSKGPIFNALHELFKHHRPLAATQGVHQESLGNRGLTWALLFIIHPRCQCQPIVNGKHLWQVSHFARSQRRQLIPGAPFTLWPSPRLLSLLAGGLFMAVILYQNSRSIPCPAYPIQNPTGRGQREEEVIITVLPRGTVR